MLTSGSAPHTQPGPQETPVVASNGQDTPNVAPSEPKATETPAPAKAKDEPLSAHYAQLARKERALRAQAQSIKEQQNAIKAQEQAFKDREAKLAQTQSLEERLAKDPWSVLQERGLTYDQLVDMAMKAPKPEEMAQRKAFEQLQNEIQALKDAQSKASKSYEDGQKQQYDQAISEIRRQTKTLVTANDDFETIRETNSVNDVVELIEKTYHKDGVLLTVEEAAQAVEDHLIEEAMKISKIKKIQQRLSPASVAKAQEPSGEPKPKQESPPVKTLTNANSTQRQYSARERAIFAAQYGADWRSKV